MVEVTQLFLQCAQKMHIAQTLQRYQQQFRLNFPAKFTGVHVSHASRCALKIIYYRLLTSIKGCYAIIDLLTWAGGTLAPAIASRVLDISSTVCVKDDI